MTYGMKLSMLKHKKNQDKNTQLKQTMANFKHKIIILEIPMNSMEQYNRRNNIETTGIPDNIRDKNHQLSVIVVIKAADIQISVTT